MEPFTILCESCAARLKVRRASMINQVLACPKCGNMVRVIPPDDLQLEEDTVPSLPPEVKLPKVKSKATDDSRLKETANSQSDFSSFEDIDELIANEGTHSTVQPKLPEPPINKKKRRPQQATAPKPEKETPEVEQPLLPNQSWTSNQAKHRQKLVLAIVGGVGILLLTIGGIVAFVVNSGKGDVAQNQPETDKPIVQPEEESNEAPKAPEVAETNEPQKENKDARETPQDTEANLVDSATPDSTPSIDDQGNTGPSELDDPLMGLQDPLVAKAPDSDQESQSPEENPLGLGADPLAGLDGGRRNRDPSTGSSIDAGNEITTRLGELNDLLSDTGTSLSSIQDLADANRRTELGRAKYYMELLAPRKNNLRRNLGMNVSGIFYQDIPLRSALDDLSSILGAPISLHVESIQAAGLKLDPKIQMKETDLNVEATVDSILDELGMEKVAFEETNQIVVLAQGWKDLKEASFSIHKLEDNSPAGQASLVRRVRGMFDEKAWNDQTVIEMKDDKLFVKQVPQVLHQIKRLLEKLKAAQALNANPADEAARTILQTEWARSQPARERELKFPTRPDISLKRLAQEIEEQASVQILIDWNSLSQAQKTEGLVAFSDRTGWWPNTMIPGEFNEPTVEDAIHQLARAMKVGYRAVDESSFELLSNSEMDSRPELQVYAVKSILNNKLTSEVLMELLGRTFQRDGGLVQVGFDSDSQAVVVVAPQYIQMQFEVVIDRLRKGS